VLFELVEARRRRARTAEGRGQPNGSRAPAAERRSKPCDGLFADHRRYL